jgi:hypothetical protein
MAPVLVVTIVIVPVIVLVYYFYLPADLAACRVGSRVYVRVGSTGADERDDGCEIFGVELLTCRAPRYDIVGGDRPSEVVGPGVARMGGRWDGTRIGRGLTKPDDDAAVHARLGDMNVSL